MSTKSKTMFFGDFCRCITKTFNPCPSLLSVATDDTKKFQCLNIALKSKTGPLVLEFSWCRDKFELFETIANPLTPKVISATLLWCRQHCYCRHENSYPGDKCEQQQHRTRKNRSHTSNIVSERFAERVWWTKYQSSLPSQWVPVTFLLLIYLRSIFLFTLHQSVAQTPIQYVTFHFRDCRGAEIAPKSQFLCVNRSPI